MSGDPYIKENERLEAEIARLRAALEEIVNWKTAKLHWEDIARKALAKEGK